MESVALPSSAVIASGSSLMEIGNPLLRSNALEIEKRMLVVEFLDDVLLGDGSGGIDGDEKILVGSCPLKAVHPVDRGVLLVINAVIPRCPTPSIFGHELFVGMEDRLVGLIGKG